MQHDLVDVTPCRGLFQDRAAAFRLQMLVDDVGGQPSLQLLLPVPFLGHTESTASSACCRVTGPSQTDARGGCGAGGRRPAAVGCTEPPPPAARLPDRRPPAATRGERRAARGGGRTAAQRGAGAAPRRQEEHERIVINCVVATAV